MFGNCWNVGSKFRVVLVPLEANNGFINLNPSIFNVLVLPRMFDHVTELPFSSTVAAPGLNLPNLSYCDCNCTPNIFMFLHSNMLIISSSFGGKIVAMAAENP